MIDVNDEPLLLLLDLPYRHHHGDRDERLDFLAVRVQERDVHGMDALDPDKALLDLVADAMEGILIIHIPDHHGRSRRERAFRGLNAHGHVFRGGRKGSGRIENWRSAVQKRDAILFAVIHRQGGLLEAVQDGKGIVVPIPFNRQHGSIVIQGPGIGFGDFGNLRFNGVLPIQFIRGLALHRNDSFGFNHFCRPLIGNIFLQRIHLSRFGLHRF